jgi:hypothetical protein
MKMKKFRRGKKNVHFLDETWVDSNLTFRNCWQGPAVMGVMDIVNANNRFILVNAGSENGHLPDAQLLYKVGSASGDYHGQTKSENFQKWLVAKSYSLPARFLSHCHG